MAETPKLTKYIYQKKNISGAEGAVIKIQKNFKCMHLR